MCFLCQQVLAMKIAKVLLTLCYTPINFLSDYDAKNK
jgi:hypothetical protein